MLRWKGLMKDSDSGVRFGSLLLLALLSVSMVATQTAYLTVGNIHVIAVLAPIVASSLMLGTLTGTAIGALAGLAELIHATMLPLDLYEAYFRAPWNSVLLMALVGFNYAIIVQSVDERYPYGSKKRAPFLVGACFIVSFLFSVCFLGSSYVINTILVAEVPDEIIYLLANLQEFLGQVLIDFVLMSLLTLISDRRNQIRMATEKTSTLRQTFQGWLLVVIVMGYLVIASLTYTFLSIVAKGTAELDMQTEIEYIENQLTERENIISSVRKRTGMSAEAAEEIHATTIAGVTSKLSLGDEAVAAVADNDVIVSSNVRDWLGKSFRDVVGGGLSGGFTDSLYQNTRSVEWYMGDGVMGYMRADRMGYMRVAKKGTYEIMVAIPNDVVFYYRTISMFVVSGAFLLVLITMYAQASILLREVVVKGFQRTNDALARITDGDLDEVVDVQAPAEFAYLSSGINTTVSSLKDSIEKTKEAIERELSTARAIQESALPSTFPPFPEIEAFDIYASMDAAKEVGGDFYDFFIIDEHLLGFLIADVSGKGIPASLFMMAAKTEIGNLMAAGMDLAEAMQTANVHLCAGNEANMFVTVWAATFDWESGLLTYVNAGHNPPLWRHQGTWNWIRERGGPFMGGLDLARYRSSTLRLEPGDELLLYTDGVTEACDPNDVLYGEEQLERYLNQHLMDHPREVIQGVRTSLARWADGAEQSDDITMLALEYGAAPEVIDSITVAAETENLERARAFLHAELGRRLCPISTQNQIDVAFEELFVNVCYYAYSQMGGKGDVCISYTYRTNPSTFTVEIKDWGVPFDPTAKANPTLKTDYMSAMPGGLGIFMAKKSVDDMSYVRDGEANVVAFTKTW